MKVLIVGEIMSKIYSKIVIASHIRKTHGLQTLTRIKGKEWLKFGDINNFYH